MPPFNQNQPAKPDWQQLLNDHYNRQGEAMTQYRDTENAARMNAQSGGNPMAPKYTSTPQGIMGLTGIQGTGGATVPAAGTSSAIYGNQSPLQGYMTMFQTPVAVAPSDMQEPMQQGNYSGGGASEPDAEDTPLKRNTRWTMGDDGRMQDQRTGQHRIVGTPRKVTRMAGSQVR